MSISRPRGTLDFLPEETEKLHWVESQIKELCISYNFGEIRTPTFEHTDLFIRGVGETTDIVEKEMYTFIDRGGRSITLRPEGTAPVVRAYIENKLFSGIQPTKLYYLGPMYRYDRPQAGRYRQFHQFGTEVLGSKDPAVDVEVISMAIELFKRLGLSNLSLHINSVGCPECRPEHKQKLQEHLKGNIDKLCKTCRERYAVNPLRIFDCKIEECKETIKEAPSITSCLCNNCREHFKEVRSMLDLLNIPYIIDEMLVRGLDYYTSTTFEILVDNIGTQNAICGGGRYDKLVEECGGPLTPGIGFAVGIERMLLALSKNNVDMPLPKKNKFFVAYIGEKVKSEAIKLVKVLREKNLTADMDYMNRSVKAQFKLADKLNFTHTIILGEDEVESGLVNIKHMATGEQDEVRLDNILSYCENLML